MSRSVRPTPSRRAILGLACLLPLLPSLSAEKQDGDWSREPPLRHPRAAHAVVVAGEAIWVLGGTGTDGRPVLEVERFDGEEWTDVATLPGGGLNAPAAAAIAGRILLIGGFETTTNVPTAEVLELDPATGAWSRGAPLPSPRGGHAAVVHQGHVHVFGGGNDRSTLAEHHVYDPGTGRWRELSPLPRSEGSPAGVVWGGRVVAIGGRSGLTDFGDVYLYDEAGDRWIHGPSLPPRGTHGAAVLGESLYVFGGESQAEGRALGDVLRLRPGSDAWEAVAPLPTPRTFARTVVFRGAAWVVGGGASAGASHAAPGLRVVERFLPGRAGGGNP